jgi:hypothetical protein
MRTPPRLHLAPSRPLNLNGDGQVAKEGMDALQNERISAAEAAGLGVDAKPNGARHA